jgi:hypothetical protein
VIVARGNMGHAAAARRRAQRHAGVHGRNAMKLHAIGLIALSLVAAPASAEPACTQRTTAGSWAFTCEGEVPAGVPTRSLGTCTTTRDAFWQCTGQINAAGTILQQAVQGQAHNHPDCTGTIVYDQTINGAPAGQLEINYVILDRGNTIWGLPLNSGGVLACSLRRISRNALH